MFGLFDGFFGEGLMADAAEMAMEMCMLDEMERDELSDDLDWEEDN